MGISRFRFRLLIAFIKTIYTIEEAGTGTGTGTGTSTGTGSRYRYR